MSKFLKFFTKQQQRDLVNDLFGYKEYVALLTQTGTSAPVATVLNKNAPNYLGDVVWTRNDIGDYTGTLTNSFNADKTVCLVSVNGNGEDGKNSLQTCVYNNVNSVSLRTGWLSPDENQLAEVVVALDFSGCAVKLNVLIKVYY